MFIILIIFVIFIFFIKYGNNKTKINNMTEKIKENNEIEIVTEEVKTYFKDNFYDKNIENKSLYESVEKYLDKINDLKSNFNETFLPYNYTKLIAKKNEQNIKAVSYTHLDYSFFYLP